MSASSSLSKEDTFFEIDGIEEEGEIIVNIERIAYIEDIKDYNDERISNEIQDLVKLQFGLFFGRISYFNQYLQNTVECLRQVIENPHRSGDEAMYQPIRKNIFPLIQVQPVTVAMIPVPDETVQVITDYLRARYLLNANGDMPMVTEARAVKLDRPYTLPSDVDKKWLSTFNEDGDCFIIASDNSLVKSMRAMGPTNWNTINGSHTIDHGDKLVFRGFMYYGRVDKSRGGHSVFNIDDYINNVNSLKEGDEVVLCFNTGKVIDQQTVTSVKGVVMHVQEHLYRFEVGKEKLIIDFCPTDLSVNDCFVYGSEYSGKKYQKSKLFNNNWMFVIEDEPIKRKTLEAMVFPNVCEGISIFPELSFVTSFRDVEKALGETPYGKESSAFISSTISNNLRTIRKKKAVPQSGLKGRKRFKNSHSVDMLQFQKNNNVMSKYFGKYALTEKAFIDSDVARFRHVSNNPHLLYAYCLNLFKNNYPSKFTKGADQTSQPIKESVMELVLPSADYTFTNISALLSAAAQEGETALLTETGRIPTVYKMKKNMWHIQSKPGIRVEDTYVVLPGSSVAIDLNATEAHELDRLAKDTSRLVSAANQNKDALLGDLESEINVHMSLGRSTQSGSEKRLREMQFVDHVDYSQMLGDGENPDFDELVNNAEVFDANYAPIVEDANEDGLSVDDDLKAMMEEPIGIVFSIFINMFNIQLGANELKIMLYNVSKYKSFDDLKIKLNEKERALKNQVQQMRANKVALGKNVIENMIKQRLIDQEIVFMTEYYGEIVSLALAFIILHVQSHLPSITLCPLTISNACNKEFSYLGFPIDNNPKSLLKYLTCVVMATSQSSGNNTPLKLAHSHFKKHALDLMIDAHINRIIEAKPHYMIRINQSKMRMDAKEAVQSTSAHSHVFYGFRPDAEVVKKKYSKIAVDDLLMHANNNRVNACCLLDVPTLVLRENQKKTVDVSHSSVKMLKKQEGTQFVDAIDIAVIHQKTTIAQGGVNKHTEPDLIDNLNALCTSSALFDDDVYLTEIRANVNNPDAWAALSAHVTLKWELLMKTVKATNVQHELWFEVFIRQEERYRNPSEVKAVFEKVVKTALPTVLGRAVNNYLLDTRHIDVKKHIPPEQREIIKSTMLDKESEFLITMLQQDKEGEVKVHIAAILSNGLCRAGDLDLNGSSHAYKVILLYNYIILKTMYMLLHASTTQLPSDVFDNSSIDMVYMSNHRVRSMSDFVKLILGKISNMMEVNHVDTHKIKMDFEKQRENVKQDLMKKMERFGKEERSTFHTLKEKTGLGNDYLDRIQRQTTELLVEADVAQEDTFIQMEWIGEDPDEVEMEDDGSGY